MVCEMPTVGEPLSLWREAMPTAGGDPFPHFYTFSGNSPKSHKGANQHQVYLCVCLSVCPKTLLGESMK